MRLFDKTPYQNERGESGLLERIQGMLRFGFTWPAELEAQKTIITQLERALEKGFALIRNLPLPGSEEIVVPLILIGPPGVYAIYVTPLKGFYEAKGDQWNVVNNGRSVPAPINLMSRVALLARAVQVYVQRQGIELPGPVEPILIAASPAMHVDSMRPAARVIMSDAVRQFAASLLQASPLFRPEFVFDLADRIVSPRSKSGSSSPVPPASPQTPAASAAPRAPSRAQAIFRSADDPKNQSVDIAELGFAFDDKPAKGGAAVPQHLRETSPAQPPPRKTARRGLSSHQLILLLVMGIVECCVLIGFGYFYFFGNR